MQKYTLTMKQKAKEQERELKANDPKTKKEIEYEKMSTEQVEEQITLTKKEIRKLNFEKKKIMKSKMFTDNMRTKMLVPLDK